MEAIYIRRSIRKYSPGPVSEEDLGEIIRAGMNAPSAGNEQPWHFVVIDRRDILDRIPEVHPYSGMIREAPVAVLVCCDLDRVRHEGFWIQDCSAATENMLLEIADRGLGSVWLGVYPREDRVRGLRKIFSLPENIVPFSLLPIGLPGEKKDRKNEFHGEMIHRNSW
ncbi:MAG: nitroreductase family protein [Spirochaetes bacterium]|jgi:nitroreductase|nr:nitroreductase family protein [Spirochaetota bacterium]